MVSAHESFSILAYDKVKHIGNSMGNPGVFQANPYPNPSKPVPQVTGTGFCWSIDFQPLPQPQQFTPWVFHGNR